VWMRSCMWNLSIDKDSLRNLQRREKKTRYWHQITKPIKKGALLPDEAVEVLSSLLVELRPEMKDALMSHDIVKGDDGWVRIESRGLPCPLCLGHLSEDAIISMFHRLRFAAMFDYGDDDDDEINSR
jgi:hypothetical protein